jgi:cytochrome c oxidase subunit 4
MTEDSHTIMLRVYVRTFVVLLILLAATWGLGYLNLGSWNGPIALLIAGGKALLIALFFMHLRGSRSLIFLAASSGVIWLLILLGFALSDYMTRTFAG